jgi:hypothetical protein
MNVTIKISDQICRAARHRAVDAGSSLSGWIADLIRKEIARNPSKSPATLLEALGNEKLSKLEIEFPRNPDSIREIDLS